MTDPQNLLIASRFVLDAAAVGLWGIGAYLLIVPAGPLRDGLEQRWLPGLRLALGLAVIALVCRLPLMATIIGSGWEDVTDVSLMWRIANQTTTGLAWSLGAGIVAIACPVLAMLHRHRLEVLTLTGMALLASLALSGHSAMHDGWPGYLHRANQWLHLLSGGFWLGALLPVTSALRALNSPSLRSAASHALVRFSRTGHLAVALVVITGALNTALILGQPPLDWSQDYQRLLAAKVGLVAAMISIAVFNRYWLVPRLASGTANLRSLQRMTWLEVILAAGVLALVVAFSALDPH